ncbi:MAG: peptidylprolyl isomerase [Candidatus Goldiibacteriota bacterium]
MMNQLRDNAKIFLWIVIVAFLGTIIFAWGAQSMGGSSSTPDIIAQAAGEDIPYSEIGVLWRNRLQELTDKGIRVDSERERKEKLDLLDEIITRRLLLDYARELNISASDEEIVQSIRNISAFHDEEGNFSRERYYRMLQAQRISPKVLEQDQARSIILSKLNNRLYAMVKTTENELKNYYLKQSRKLKTEFVYFNYNDFKDEISISEDRISNYYSINRKDYEKPERVNASHILIIPDASPTSPTGLTEEGAQELAAEVLKKAKAGEDFGGLARQYSQDPGSKNNDGELGWFERGTMIKEFEDAAFSLKKGGISDVVKSQFGYHIIKVHDKEEGSRPTYEKVKGQIREELTKQEGLKLAEKKAETFLQNIEEGASFTKAAKEADVMSVITGFFDSDEEVDIIDASEFQNELFDLNINDFSDPIAGENGYYVFKILAEKPSKFNEEDFKEKENSLDEKLKNIKFRQIREDLTASLRAKADVKVFEENLF